MFCFSGALLLYAAVMALTRDDRMIARHYAAKMKDKKAYAAAFARKLAILALAPLAGGLFGLIHEGLGLFMLLANAVVGLWFITKF